MTGTKHADRGVFAERVLLARKRAGLTQRELARRVGVSTRTVGYWENGNREARGLHLLLLARETQQPVDWFYPDDLTVAA